MVDASQHMQAAAATNAFNTGSSSRARHLADPSNTAGELLEGVIRGAVQAGFTAQRDSADGGYRDVYYGHMCGCFGWLLRWRWYTRAQSSQARSG